MHTRRWPIAGRAPKTLFRSAVSSMCSRAGLLIKCCADYIDWSKCILMYLVVMWDMLTGACVMRSVLVVLRRCTAGPSAANVVAPKVTASWEPRPAQLQVQMCGQSSESPSYVDALSRQVYSNAVLRTLCRSTINGRCNVRVMPTPFLRGLA